MRAKVVLRVANKYSQVTEDQVNLFCRLSDDLVRAFQVDSTQLRYLPEYERFILGAYACGFVCADFSSLGNVLHQAERAGWVEEAPFVSIRRYVHTLIRSERHADMGEDWGGGNIYQSLRNGVLQRVVSRMNTAQEWREGNA